MADPIPVVGDIAAWKLLCEVRSEEHGWRKSTRAMYIPGAGCLVRTNTQLLNPPTPGHQHTQPSFAVAEALAFVPHVMLEEVCDSDKKPIGWRLASSLYA